MKRLMVLVVFVTVLAGTPLVALDLGLGFGIGLNVGALSYEQLNAKIESDDSISPYSQIGITVGAVSRLQILPILGLQAEALFTITGGGYANFLGQVKNEKTGEVTELWNIERETHFTMQFPLLVYLPLPLFGEWYPSPHAGIAYDMLIGSPSSENFLAESQFGNPEESSDLNPVAGDWRRFGLSWVAGLDLETRGDSVIGGIGLRLTQQIEGFGPDDGTEAEQRLLTNFSVSLRGIQLF